MMEGWADRLTAAQLKTHTHRAGRLWPRVPYGKEAGMADPLPQCRDCATPIGSLHVPLCCVERCPACGGQYAWCNCARDEQA